MRASVKSATAKRAPTSISRAASSEVVNPTTASPAAAAARTPESESSKARDFSARSGSLERGQIGQRIGLGARQLAADDADRQTLREADRRQHEFGVDARRVGYDRAREPASVGEVEQRGDAGDRPDIAEAVAIGGLLGGQPLLAQIVRQMRQKFLPDHLV